MPRLPALLLTLSCFGGLGCAGKPVFAPRAPVRAELVTAGTRVRAEIVELDLVDEHGPVVFRLAIAAGARARLVDARLVGAAAPPCTAGTGVAEVIVDDQEHHQRGPADISGHAHQLVLRFVGPPVGEWRQDQVALELQLEVPTATCLRLTMTGTRGADWE